MELTEGVDGIPGVAAGGEEWVVRDQHHALTARGQGCEGGVELAFAGSV